MSRPMMGTCRRRVPEVDSPTRPINDVAGTQRVVEAMPPAVVPSTRMHLRRRWMALPPCIAETAERAAVPNGGRPFGSGVSSDCPGEVAEWLKAAVC
jgi:hypothetical protein